MILPGSFKKPFHLRFIHRHFNLPEAKVHQTFEYLKSFNTY